MRKSSMVLALVLSGCGGTTPEVYQVLLNFFTLPDSCYRSMTQPNTVATAQPPAAMTVQLWDGPDNIPFLQVESNSLSIDMGDAPSVNIDGIFTGKRGDKGWTFSSDTGAKQTVLAGTTITSTITSATHAEVTFERGVTFKGTGALSSSTTCVGTACPGTNPACSVSGIVITGTKVAVDYERAP